MIAVREGHCNSRVRYDSVVRIYQPLLTCLNNSEEVVVVGGGGVASHLHINDIKEMWESQLIR